MVPRWPPVAARRGSSCRRGRSSCAGSLAPSRTWRQLDGGAQQLCRGGDEWDMGGSGTPCNGVVAVPMVVEVVASPVVEAVAPAVKLSSHHQEQRRQQHQQQCRGASGCHRRRLRFWCEQEVVVGVRCDERGGEVRGGGGGGGAADGGEGDGVDNEGGAGRHRHRGCGVCAGADDGERILIPHQPPQASSPRHCNHQRLLLLLLLQLGSGCTFTLQCLSTPSPTVLVVLLLRLLGAALAMVSLLAERCAPLSL
ncbi:hypothetical protein OsJ_21881 [Oryza sativa Japonica Group]|uniref:Uncharacterized protein n=1 Tax=Oryza sativa subsp. japonica TaxID=39947 RepID=B9FU08_ORYSJ|nr:hypothetical protein OsJ_21881 [Oryza sativa Japonica Group]